MAYTRGRCTNFDYCSIASSRRDVEVPVGDDFVCPECGKPLRPPQAAGAAEGRNYVLPAILGGGVLLLISGGIFVGMRLGGGAPQPAPRNLAAAPAAATPTPAPATPATPQETLLARMAAAPLFANGLAPALAGAYLTQIGDTDIRTERTATAGVVNVSGLRGDRREAIAIQTAAPAWGFQALGSHATDLVLSPRRVTQGEHDSLAALGDMTSTGAEHVIGLGAIAIVVNAHNALPQIRRDQIAGAFTGTIHDWSGLGASAAPLDVFGPAANGDLAGLFGTLALNGAALSPAVRQMPGATGVADAVTTDGRGIGYTDIANIGQARAVPVAETGATPVSPTDRGAIAREDYPLAFRSYLYTPANASGTAARLAEFALSAAGQAVVQKSGLVLQSEKQAAPAAAPVTAQAGYKAFVAGARKLAVTFHFNPNSTDLDLKGTRDLDRVMNYILSNHYTPDALILVGFADNQGDPAQNLDVSRKRADAVAQLFIKRGMKPGKWGGFGSELEVADNATEDGREKNRRVEVYVKQ